ncbi:MAG: hypothetical protein QF662_04920, partial [Phycisphaerae bacterium]|nr:hypothetical protein [Phycisphaerae bacterium]
MLAAQLHHKLSREEEGLEDLLTSNVFGAFGYVPFEEGILPFLQEARSETGNGLHDILSDVTSAKYVFWPWLQEADCIGAEPD